MYFYSNKHFAKSMNFASLTMIVIILSDHIATFLRSLFASDNLILHLILFVFISMAISLILRNNIFRIPLRNTEDRSFVVFTILINLLYFTYLISILVLRSLGNHNELIITNFIFLSLYVILFLISMFFITYALRLEQNRKIKESENEFLSISLKKQEKHNLEIKRFRHDYKNILFSMEDYIKNGDIEGLKKYYNENIRETASSLDSDTTIHGLNHLQIPEIKGLLLNKLLIITENKIPLSFTCDLPITEIPCKKISLIRGLGIILDNAIDEVRELEEGRISIAFINNEKDLQIIIINTCRENIEPLYKLTTKGYSTKKNGEGVGLSNLQKIAEKDEKFIV